MANSGSHRLRATSFFQRVLLQHQRVDRRRNRTESARPLRGLLSPELRRASYIWAVSKPASCAEPPPSQHFQIKNARSDERETRQCTALAPIAHRNCPSSSTAAFGICWRSDAATAQSAAQHSRFHRAATAQLQIFLSSKFSPMVVLSDIDPTSHKRVQWGSQAIK